VIWGTEQGTWLQEQSEMVLNIISVDVVDGGFEPEYSRRELKVKI
jgi:hypothetical protein